jgi:hypothetical protein
MRKIVRSSGVAASCSVVTLLGLFAALAPAQGGAPTGASASDAKPPVAQRQFYRAPSGQLYVPAGVPLHFNFGLAPEEGSAAAHTQEESSVILKEGPGSAQMGVVRVPVIADGTPPKTQLDIGSTPHFELEGRRIVPSKPTLHLTASDALSGVAVTMISLDGAPFAPSPVGGPVVTVEGNHRLRYYSVDHVGNQEKMQEFDFCVDGTPPRTRLTTIGPHAKQVIGAETSLVLAATDAVAGVDAIRFRLDGGSEQIYDNPFQLDTLAEGAHHLQFHAEDRVGNVETPQSFDFLIDRQPPEVKVSIRGPVYPDQGTRYVSLESTIELESRDAVAGPLPVHYKTDGATAETLYSTPIHLPRRTGFHRFSIVSADPVDNRAELSLDDLYVDMTPPETDIEFSRPFVVLDGETVLNPTSLITFHATDFESGVKSVSYSLDGGPEQNYSVPISIPDVGAHRLVVYATDHVGNREKPRELRIRVQQTSGPAVPAVLDAKRWYMHPKLGLMGPEGLPFELRISNSPDPGAESFPLVSGPGRPEKTAVSGFSTPGRKRISLGIFPKAEPVFVLIDGAAPKTELNQTGARRVDVGGVTYFGPGLKFAMSSEDNSAGISSGLWKTLFSLDGTDFAPYTAPLTSFDHDGAYILRYYALDNVGNAEPLHTVAFTVDTHPPKTRLELQGPHHASTVAPVTRIALVSSDNLSGVAQVSYSIDHGKDTPYSEPFSIGKLSDGEHSLRYYAIDAVGNRENEQTWPFTVVGTVSAASYTLKGNTLERGGKIYTGAGSSIVLKPAEGDFLFYSIDGSEAKPYAARIPAPNSGSHTLSFHAVDSLGNVGPSRTLSISADSTPPHCHIHFVGLQTVRDSLPVISGATRIVIQADPSPLGASTIEYSFDGKRWLPYSAPLTMKANGTASVMYRARDALSVTGPTEKQTMIVDNQGPVIGVLYSKPVETAGDTVAVELGTLMFVTAEDVPAGLDKITTKVDDQPEKVYRTPLSGFSLGKTHSIEIVAVDALGNRTQKLIHLRVKELTQ